MSRDFKIVLVPSNKLREESRVVLADEFGEELDEYMDSMVGKMIELNGVGLSGVQVGDPRRILVADAGSGPAKMVNPEILEFSDEKVSYTEGCLSLPGMRLAVERSKYIKMKYTTPMGEPVEGTLTDIQAVIVQHEIDHLNGKTLLDKVSRLKKDMYLKKLKKKVRAQKKLIKKMKEYGY